jgi:hypothetical protein
LPSAIVVDERFFLPSGVAKKCVDAESSHTPEHLLVRGPQMSLGSAGWSDRYRQSVRPGFYGSPQKSNELLPGRDPVRAGVPWCVLASARPVRMPSIIAEGRITN